MNIENNKNNPEPISSDDKIDNVEIATVKKEPVSTKDIPLILQSLLESQNRLLQLLKEREAKQCAKEEAEAKTTKVEEEKEQRVKDGKGGESISKGIIETHKYRDYWDRHHIIVTANATDPNDPDSVVYTANADQMDKIYINLGRNADILYVKNDGTDTLYTIVSHRGTTGFSKEEFIYAGEIKTFWNVYEIRFRSPTTGLNYRVTEYEIQEGSSSCETDSIRICGTSTITSITQLTSIEKGVIHNTALPAIGADFFAAALSPTNTPTMFRINAAISIVGNLTATIIRGGNTQTVTLNVIPGPALVAGGLYEFNLMVHSGDTVNFRYSTTGGTIQVFRVTEVDAAVT